MGASATIGTASARTTASEASALDRMGFYAGWAWRFVVLGRPAPLIYGMAITDRCNFSCAGCRVANTGRPDMTYAALVGNLSRAYERGFREVYFTGGEPTMWRDGERTLADAIEAARRAGFFHVHLYTNGSRGLDWPADLVWTSMDGLPETFALRRGDHFAQVERAIRDANRKVAVIYTIDRYTARDIEPFLRWVRGTRLPVLGVMFYFHTPYYGVDELFLSAEERAPVIERLRSCVREGLPVLNSHAGLRALASGKWERRTPAAVVADVDGESVCCRAPEAACKECGYAACTEIVEARHLRPSAVLAMGRYW